MKCSEGRRKIPVKMEMGFLMNKWRCLYVYVHAKVCLYYERKESSLTEASQIAIVI